MRTYNIPFSTIFLNLQQRDIFQGTQELVRNSHGTRAISVRATEVLLYKQLLYNALILSTKK